MMLTLNTSAHMIFFKLTRPRYGVYASSLVISSRALTKKIKTLERELRRGMTLLGPHRDDLRFGIASGAADVNLRIFGSAGQQRTAAIALRMVEADTLRNARGRRPIVMLDDVFAELDPERSRRVIEMLSDLEWGQVIVTSPKPDEYALLGGRLREYRIEQGRIDSA